MFEIIIDDMKFGPLCFGHLHKKVGTSPHVPIPSGDPVLSPLTQTSPLLLTLPRMTMILNLCDTLASSCCKPIEISHEKLRFSSIYCFTFRKKKMLKVHIK